MIKSSNVGLRFFVFHDRVDNRWEVRDRTKHDVHRLGKGGRRPHRTVARCMTFKNAEVIATLLNEQAIDGRDML